MQTVGEKCSIGAAVEFCRVEIVLCDNDTKTMKTSLIIWSMVANVYVCVCVCMYLPL